MPKLKDIPVCPKPPAARPSGRVEKKYSISLITPLFGGGAEPGRPDEDFPIRGTAIRGQLEFWWRATRGTQFDIFVHHADIWGMGSEVLMRENQTHSTMKEEQACVL
jgi:CRISPR/Cas system CMR-associated protein Cmr1 (group 7 of RAMP superfamily)